MTLIAPQQQPIHYSPTTIARAERAARCTPFQFALFTTMRWQSVELKAIAGTSGVTNGYTCRPTPELSAENALLWLMQVGMLRREVDGQGLTDSFRLTPLGHQLVEQWHRQGATLPPATWGDRLHNVLNRWGRLPSWLQ